MQKQFVLTLWILCQDFDLVSASSFGVEGQIILGVFIPISIVVIILCIGRACWTYHLAHNLDQWTYDPYLDLSLRDKHPKYVPAPNTKGRVVRECSFNKESPQSMLKKQNINGSLSSLAAATFKLGDAMVFTFDNITPLREKNRSAGCQLHQSELDHGHEETRNATLGNYTPVNRDTGNVSALGLNNSPQNQASTPKSLLSSTLNTEFLRSINDTNLSCVHSRTSTPVHRVSKSHDMPGLTPKHPKIEQTLSFLCGPQDVKDKQKQPTNPYGDSTDDRKYSMPDFAETKNLIQQNSLRGLKPCFRTYVKVKYSEAKNQLIKMGDGLSLRSKHKEPTSRDLQRDVKRQEERALACVSALPNYLCTSFFINETQECESFQLGPVSVPLSNSRRPDQFQQIEVPQRPLETKFDKEVVSIYAREPRTLQFESLEEYDHRVEECSGFKEDKSFRNSTSTLDCTSSSKATNNNSSKNSVLPNDTIGSRNSQSHVKLNWKQAANQIRKQSVVLKNLFSSSPEDYQENYNDIFEELFERSYVREE